MEERREGREGEKNREMKTNGGREHRKRKKDEFSLHNNDASCSPQFTVYAQKVYLHSV